MLFQLKKVDCFKPTRLYIKKIGDIFYFGKYSGENIQKYTGSGIIWKKYIKGLGKQNIKHLWNSDWYYDPIEIQEIALKFSIENDIVNSEKWANVIPEDGIGLLITDDIKSKISIAQKECQSIRSEEEKLKIIEKQIISRKKTWDNRDKEKSKLDYINRGKKLSEHLKKNPRPKEHANAMHESMKNKSQEELAAIRKKVSDKLKGIPKPQKIVKCPKCGKKGGISNLKRWHFDKCEKEL
jgi:hypothetical protein